MAKCSKEQCDRAVGLNVLTVVVAVAYPKTGAEAMHEHLQTQPPDLPDEYANVPVAEYDEGN